MIFNNNIPVSNCCGAPAVSNGDCDTQDFGICSDCGEHCEYIDDEQGDDLDIPKEIQTL